MPPKIPFSEIKSLAHWANFHGTIETQVPLYCTPDVVADIDADVPSRLLRHGQAIQAVLRHCFEQKPAARLRVMGARWSMSNIIQPSDVVLDPANLNVLLKVKPEWLSADYRTQRAAFTPVFVQGGTHISSINRRLGQIGLALQTTGASDGHRIAGCVATGSHGSALSVGAVHDTLLAVHVITGPDRAVLLQPAAAACTDDLAGWLTTRTGIPTRSLRDDALFGAAQVSLGSLGIVHGVVVEAAPLYRLQQRKLVRPFSDRDLWHAIKTLDTSKLHPDRKTRPYHFEVVLHPYPGSNSGAYVVLMWKEDAGSAQFAGPMPVPPDLATDTIGLISHLSAVLDGPLSSLAIKHLIGTILDDRYKPGNAPPAFPGDMFGPTGTPPGNGISTEIVVDHARTEEAVDAIYDVLRAEAASGRCHLGPVALRFVPKSAHALLGMNIHEQNTFIEMPSAGNREVRGIFDKCWSELERRNIPFTCHWGQVHGLDRSRLDRYFGPRIRAWLDARHSLLPEPEAQRVFASPLLESVQLV